MSTAINFPDSPSLNDTYTYGNITFKFDGTRWSINSASTFTPPDNSVTTLKLADDSVTTPKLAPTYKLLSALVSSNLDWSAYQAWDKTLTGNTTWTFSNLHLGVKDVEVTGDFTLGFPAYVKVVSGAYDGTVANLIQFKCVNAGSGNESVWCTISQELS